jgi:predicted aldo/keto reductase-like oxidoreductase
MQAVRLGKTGLMVSRVGMGGIPLTRPTEGEAIRVVRRALDLGVNFIDTARGYGISEDRIGKAVAMVADRRDSVFIATKGGGDKSGTLRCIEDSLKHLNVDAIDLWQFHGVNTFEYLERVLGSGGGMEGAQEALQAGKIRHIGFSSHSLKVALKAVASGHFETVQFPLNFVSNEAADELISLAKEYDVGFIAMKPFAGGRIRRANLAIKYLLQFDSVVPDPGVEKIEEIEEIVGIVNSDTWEPTPQEQKEIEEIRAKVGTRFCRQCEYCMPCPQGVHICGTLYLEILWDLWPPELYFARHSIGGYVTNAVESAKNCVQCGECEDKCPYQLPIREMIVENVAFYERVAAEHGVR